MLTVTIFTRMLADFGTEVLAGYGIGARLEFMLTSIAFAVGIASVPMVGMAIGAGRVARARRIAWIAGCVSFVSVGLIATVIAIFPDLWVNIFTNDPGVRAASRQYLHTAAPMYAFIGLSISMYFSSQGAAKVLGPVLAQTARLLFVGVGGWWLLTARGDRRELLCARGGIDGGARHAVGLERGADEVGTEGGAGSANPPGAV